jgi:four helix bundle protein
MEVDDWLIRRATLGGMMPYERLDAWRFCHELLLAVYRASETWPKSELYGLVAQARRAATSAGLNIAEGASKRGPREFRRFLDVTLGSLGELDYALRIAHDLDYLEATEFKRLRAARNQAGKAVWGLYKAMGRACGEP